MSIITNIDDLCWEKRQKIHKDLEIKIENKYAPGMARYVYPFEINDDNIILPFAYATRNLQIKRPSRESYPNMNVDFGGVLREEQKEILEEATNYLSTKGSVIISAYTGFGKSIVSIRLACMLHFQTLIVVNKVVLMKQWKESILKFCPNARVQIVTPKSAKEDSDFYVMNAQNVEKMGKQYFSDIGTVIVDEAHLIMAETLSRSLQYVYPRYLIGLTATPYRPDGLDILLLLYFGKYKIFRKLWRDHTVYRVSTGFKPTIEKAANGRVNWGVVLDSQANDVERNELIVSLLKYFSKRNFLVLVKRISQGDYILKRLEEEGEDCTSLLGSKQEFEKSSRVLIGTSGKVGVGFDHSKLDALLLAADVEEYFIQYLGRVFRTKEVEPVIIDLVDKYSLLEKHFATRRNIYQEHGGTVKNFNLQELK